MIRTIRKTALRLLLAATALPIAGIGNLKAHEGHDDAPGESGMGLTSDPITITAEARENLKLATEMADLRTLENAYQLLGFVEAIPTRMDSLTTRISGRVTRLAVNEGEVIKKGQFLLEIESRQIGDPPPSIEYHAPLDGIVLDRHILPGDSVEPNAHLLKIADLSEVYAVGNLFEGQIAAVRKGQKARVYVESYPKQVFEGEVERIGAALDPDTRTLKVWIRLPNPDYKLLPNMRATLYLVIAEADTVITVPNSAVLGEFGNYFLFVQAEDDPLTFERRPVVIGLKDDRYIEVIEGVLPGEPVVTAGNYQLQYVAPVETAEVQEDHAH